MHSRPRFCLPDHGYASRCHFSLFPSTKSGFLCAFTLQNPRFRAFRAQNRHFCAFLPSETLVFGLFKHKIEVFVRFCQQVFPDYGFYGLPCQQHLPDGYPPQRRQSLRLSAPASNKPHPTEKSTPVWLAIWHIWAGFANSQLQCATFPSTYSYKCTSSLLPTCNRCSNIANLSAHLHRLPTPPPYLRRMRLSPGRGRRCWMSGEVAAWPGAAFLQITARTNPCSRHLWGTLARAVASI